MEHRRMTVRGRSAFVVGALVMLGAPVAGAQTWGRPDSPRSGACFYRDSNFRGDYFCVNAGRDYSSLSSDMNNQISSIRMFGDAQVTIFQEPRFGGRGKDFRGEVRNLKDEGWNDRISSLRVRGSGGSGGYGGGGYSSEQADRIVRRAYEDILDREADTAGLRLYRSRMVDDGWSEKDVRDALRKSPEYKEKTTMTRQQAEDVVARAYRSVLDREPDPGSRSYVDKVLREHWTEQDVARELRKSPEYKNKGR